MSAQDFLPPIPQPPHDPTSWLLNARVGWKEARLDQVEKRPLTGSLALAPVPGRGRSLTEASGSFGGLTVPAPVALGPDGSIYLLDAPRLQLKKFDPCQCLFETIPCFGGEGQGPRHLHDPHGIGICGGNLFVCDTGNHRLAVFSLHGFVLRGHWQPPASAYKPPHPKLTSPWSPDDVAFDSLRRVYVSDGANGCIHRFSPWGRWETCLSGFGTATYLAIDCRDRLYVVADGVERTVRVVDAEGRDIGLANRPEALEPVFRRLPFVVDTAGNLHLGPLCVEAGSGKPATGKADPTPERGVFDTHGDLVTSFSSQASPAYQKQGLYVSQALDSELYRCQWHRILVRGRIPPGARVEVSTYTAEVLLPDDQVQNLPVDAWDTRQIASDMTGGDWDCLVRSGGGRYLWLRLELTGNGKVTPILETIVIEFPRLSLRRFLPAVFGMEPVSADFTDRFLGIFDTTIRSLEEKIDNLARYFDPLSTPADRNPKTGVDFLSWLAAWIGVSLDRHWPEAKRRQFLQRAGKLYDLRGTRQGLWRQLLLILDMEADQHCCPHDQPQTRCRPSPANCGQPRNSPAPGSHRP